MAYVSSSFSSIKDTSILYRAQNLPKHLKQSKIPKKLPKVFSVCKDPEAKKPIKVVIVPEKKKIHGRSPMCNNQSLPYIRMKSNLEKQNLPLIKLDFPLSNSSLIFEKLNKSFIVSDSSESVSQITKKINLDSDKTKTADKDLRKQLSIDFENSEEFVSPSILKTTATSFKSSKPSTLPAISLASLPKPNKSLQVDSFYYKNILSHSDFSSFHSILEGSLDLRATSFPYCRAVLQNSKKVKQVAKNALVKASKAQFECYCKNSATPSGKASWYLRITELKKVVPWLQAVLVSPQPSMYKKNLVLVNFSGVFGRSFLDVSSKTRTVSCIKKLSKTFKIILICENTSERPENLASMFKDLGIPISGVYEVHLPTDTSRELKKTLDYSKIYQDFCVLSPEKQVLILTSHRIADTSHAKLLDYIVTKKLSYKLNAERLPVHSEEYSLTPLTVLLPHHLLPEHPGPLNRIIRQVRVNHRIDSIYDSLHFKILLSQGQANKVGSGAIHNILQQELQSKPNQPAKPGIFCKLHRKQVSIPDPSVETMYLI